MPAGYEGVEHAGGDLGGHHVKENLEVVGVDAVDLLVGGVVVAVVVAATTSKTTMVT